MSMAGDFLQEMIMLYCIGILGFVVRKKDILNRHTNDVLTQLILYITLPALILFSLDIPFSFTVIKEFLWLLSMSVYVLTLAILLAFWMRKRAHLPKKQESVYESLIIFGNQGFIGYAVCFILFKEQGIIYLSLFNLFYLLCIWSYGIFLFTKRKTTIKWKSVLLNPGILSTVAGFMVLFSPFRFPEIFSSALESVGKMTIPLSMILIGSLLANTTYKDIPFMLKNPYLWKSAVARLLIIPLLLLPFLLLPVSFPLLAIAMLVSGMPSAPTTSLFSQKFGADTNFATLGVLLTTVLCIFTIPFLYMLLHLF
ncbi:AEC family transporter [Virgibacillus alimentarius]|uniref:Permease n=1 Tax=Virgibacillus alimentarius TaxID=698769 RepID=A0ABS4S9P8_9BACI|nr:AEC family transporter [Virgibacillus alimentarius]MBP2257599.1 putative permease [Virgibacillus alimentarius]